MTPRKKHLCVVTVPAWVRRLRSPLIFSLLSLDQTLLITYFAPTTIEEKTRAFVSRDFSLSEQESARLRLCFVEDAPEGIQMRRTAIRVISDYYEALISGAAIEDLAASPPVTAFLTDIFAHDVLTHARANGFQGEMANWLLVAPSAAAHFTLRGLQAKKSADSILCEVQGALPQYTYESSCTTTPFSSPVGRISASRSLIHYRNQNSGAAQDMEMDALDSWRSGHTSVISFTREILPGTAASFQAQTHGRVIIVDPQFPSRFWDSKGDFRNDDPVFTFLAKQKPRSVLYISFGSLFFPSNNTVDILLDALLTSKMPFIFCLGAKLAGNMGEYRDKFTKRVSESGNCYSDWLDQPLLLKHPAIKWVLSHGGCNTLLESLICGLPMTIMPFTADQPTTGHIIERQLSCGTQVWEHRDRIVGKDIAARPGFQVTGTSEALRKELDGLLQVIAGPEGERMTANAQKVSELLHTEHREHADDYAREFLALI